MHVPLPPVEPVIIPSPEKQPSQLVIKNHAESVVDFNEDVTIRVSRAEMWPKALQGMPPWSR